MATSSSASSNDIPRNKSAPTVRGAAQEGKVLQADPGRWRSGSPISYSYQWRRCLADGTSCIDVPKATDLIYTPRGDDVGRSLRVVVTARNKDGTASVLSAVTAPVAALPAQAPHNAGSPGIGAASPGKVIQASPGTWTGASPIALSYRWRRCDTSGGSCTDTRVRGQSYTLSAGDAGHAFRVLVTATNAAGASASLSDPSAPVVGPARPASSSPPTISGLPQQGTTLVGNRGAWSNGPTSFEYRWLRCGKDGGHCDAIDGGRATTYVLTAADVGHTIRFAVRARNGSGTTTAVSAPSGIVLAPERHPPARPQNKSLPTVTGTPQQGQTLRADRGTWTDTTDYDYTWTRCDTTGATCNDITGAHGTSYTLTAADVGHRLRFRVTAKNAGGGTTGYSAATSVVTPAPVKKTTPPTNTSRPAISGAAQEGKTLSGSRGSWTNNPTDYDYSWRRCNTSGDGCDAISGAHSTTYTLTGADIGHTTRFRVKAKNAAGSESAISAPTAIVRAAAKPESSSPPTVSGTPQEGNTLAGNRGIWTHNPTGFDYTWLRCDHAGGSCAAISGATNANYTISSADVGNTLRFRVTAKNSEGATAATSVPTAVIQKAPSSPPPPPRATGCPPRANITQTANVATIASPARLLVDSLRSVPPIPSRRTFTLVVRFHVTSSCGGPVQGALVYATATPYNQFTIPPEATTGADGWATLVFRRLRNFPVNGHQQLIAMFVRARKPGESLLGGISTRRLVSIPVTLR